MATDCMSVDLRRVLEESGAGPSRTLRNQYRFRGLAVREEFESLWHKLSEELMTGMKEWRLQHPRATLSEIEEALGERLSKMRARMLEDLALASARRNLAEKRVEYPECGGKLESRGQRVRKLKTHHNQELTLSAGIRRMSGMRGEFFPPR